MGEYDELVEPSNVDLGDTPDSVLDYMNGLEAKVATLEAELAAMKARGDRLAEALEAVKASMANGGDGQEGDYGWNITRLNRARPLVRQALTEWRDQHHGGNDADT